MEAKHKFLSPAKVNVFLQICGKREDGFHEIASLFQAISVADELTFQLSKSDLFSCNQVALQNEQNLVIQARNLFRKRSKKPFYLHMHLEKKVPIQSGLGSASSNAATTLWALNTLLDFPFSPHELFEMGKLLGADVNFFFSKGTAFCTGKGEVVEEVPFFLPLKGYLAMPHFSLSTQSVYQKVDLQHLIARENPRKTLEKFQKGEYVFFNDLEKFSFRLDSRMFQIKQDLLALGFSTVLMSGSGSCFFCLGEAQGEKNLASVQFFPFVSIPRNGQNWYS